MKKQEVGGVQDAEGLEDKDDERSTRELGAGRRAAEQAEGSRGSESGSDGMTDPAAPTAPAQAVAPAAEASSDEESGGHSDARGDLDWGEAAERGSDEDRNVGRDDEDGDSEVHPVPGLASIAEAARNRFRQQREMWRQRHHFEDVGGGVDALTHTRLSMHPWLTPKENAANVRDARPRAMDSTNEGGDGGGGLNQASTSSKKAGRVTAPKSAAGRGGGGDGGGGGGGR
ncbi:MAG: hypothetical protein WDW36_006455 [Sanguina aurantia]